MKRSFKMVIELPEETLTDFRLFIVTHGGKIIRTEKISPVTTICYGEEKKWDNREEAKEFFMDAMSASEGSEHDRYFSIYEQLCAGEMICSDEEDY